MPKHWITNWIPTGSADPALMWLLAVVVWFFNSPIGRTGFLTEMVAIGIVAGPLWLVLFPFYLAALTATFCLVGALILF